MFKVVADYKDKFDAEMLCDVIDATYQFPDYDITQFRDALSTGQIGSKLWLASELFRQFPEISQSILVVGGWIGTLSLILFKFKRDLYITSLDIDARMQRISATVNRRNKDRFVGHFGNMLNLVPNDYLEFDTVINTSCEHIEDVRTWSDNIPCGKIVVAQSNDFFDCPQHVNCVNSVEELKDQLNLTEVLYKGSKVLPGTYTRFMVIGIK